MIPVDKTLLFTVAGMVPFKSYFTGEETAAVHARGRRSQKCVRAGGKHNDLDDIGRTNRHFSFFEMLGNFSFGDYFKADAIPWAWEFYTRRAAARHEPPLGDRPRGRRRSRAHLARRRGLPGRPDPTPRRRQLLAHGRHRPVRPVVGDLLGPRPRVRPRRRSRSPRHDRYIEIWNLVFMQFDQQADGTRVPLPKPSIDTGAGLERNLMVVQGKTSIWDIDVFRPLHRGGRARHRRALRRQRARPTSRCASSPSTRAR